MVDLEVAEERCCSHTSVAEPVKRAQSAGGGACTRKMLKLVAASRCTQLMERNRPTWYFALLMVAYVLYLVFGAVVFSSVELPYEDQLRKELRELKQSFVSDNQCLSAEQLERFLERVLEANNYGVSILSNMSGNWNWDFMSSLFFASTVLSTTGYGHTVPLSDGGKTFCILYSVIGIPFTLLLFTALVQRIIIYVTHRPILFIHLRWGFPKHIVSVVHTVLLGFLVVTCFFFIPAAAFSVLEEDWNFLESFYFCFISLSTIGLGDYVPGEGYNQRYRELYKFGITGYLLIGLVAMLVVLESFCELQGMKRFRKLFYVKKTKDEDQENIMEHDQLAFSSITDQMASLKEDQKLDEPFVARQPVINYTDGSINNDQ